jgi:hypothetical protein
MTVAWSAPALAILAPVDGSVFTDTTGVTVRGNASPDGALLTVSIVRTSDNEVVQTDSDVLVADGKWETSFTSLSYTSYKAVARHGESLTRETGFQLKEEDGGGGGTGGGPTHTGGRGGSVVTVAPEPAAAPALNKIDHYRYLFGYEDGSIRPENDITREEVAEIFYRLLTAESRGTYRQSAAGFWDVEAGRWSASGIGTMRQAEVVTGYPDGAFRPAGPITRGEFAAIAARFEQASGAVPHNFSDLSGHWSEQYVAFAAQKGWIFGYPDGTFRPDRPITRAEAVTLINRMLDRQADAEGVPAELVPDYGDITPTHWAYYSVLEAAVSHLYQRRHVTGPLENWTGAGPDMDFDAE